MSNRAKNQICDINELGKCAEKVTTEILASGRGDKATVILLSGNLGSGKTTFVKALAKHLGIEDVVLSPTFVIEKIYKLPAGKPFRHLVHIDAYRLEKPEELSAIGFEEIISAPENLIVIEWPEKMKKLLPKNAHEIEFEFVDEKTRKITILLNGAKRTEAKPK